MILLALCAAWLTGLGLAAAGHPEASLAGLPLGAGMAAGFTLRSRPGLALLSLAGALLFGAAVLRFEAALPAEEPGGVALLNGGPLVRLAGTIASDPEERGVGQRFVFDVDAREEGGDWTAERGRVLVTARAFPPLSYGDRLEVQAALDTPPAFDAFDYREYLARRGISSVASFPEVRRVGRGAGSALTAGVIGFRDRLGESLAAALPEPEAALARGMLLGQRSAIPEDLTEDFNRAGISHLIAISGSNVSLIAALALAAFTWPLGRRWAVLAAMAFIAVFVVLVGASPSVLRAGVMAVFLLGAVLAGRPGSSITAVAFAAALLTAASPLAALDLAFQLSFAATLGLVLLAPRLSGAFTGSFARILPTAAATWLGESFALTVASSVAVFPVIAAAFERVSLAAIPANLVAVPLFAAVIVTSALTAALGLVSEGAGRFVGSFAGLPLSLLAATARSFAALPGASLGVRGFGLGSAVLFYAALAAAALALSRRSVQPPDTGLRLGLPPALAASVLALAVAGAAWSGLFERGPGNLAVIVLDVGQGDAILIEAPSGTTILVDGGPSGPALLNALGEVLGSRRRIDLIVLTHPQQDHVAGLVAVTERYDVAGAATAGSFSALPAYYAWRDALGAGPTPVTVLRAGEAARAGEVMIEVLGPPPTDSIPTGDDLNDSSVVLRVSYGSVSFLLTGDLGFKGEQALMARTGSVAATVLKVGHHGSDTSTSAAFIEAVRPSLAVISAGSDNTYGHPSPSTLLRLAGIPVYRTDRNGSVRFETDGRRLFVRPSRGSYELIPISAAR